MANCANQPTLITASGLSEAHTYDGNLKRVKTVRNGVTTAPAGAFFTFN